MFLKNCKKFKIVQIRKKKKFGENFQKKFTFVKHKKNVIANL